MMAQRDKRLEIEEACHKARCKLSLVHNLFVLASETDDLIITKNAWYGFDLIMDEVEAAIDLLTGMDEKGLAELRKEADRQRLKVGSTRFDKGRLRREEGEAEARD